MKIQWSPLAQDRLVEIAEYISDGYPLTAMHVLEAIIHSADRLEIFPLSGRIVPEFNEPGIREVIHPPYRILYEIIENTVEILTVIHSRQLLTEENLQELS